MKRGNLVATAILALLGPLIQSLVAEEQPLVTLVHFAHTNVTRRNDVPPDRPLSQGLIERFHAAIDVANRQRPDFAMITGNLTWSGDPNDYMDLEAAVGRLRAPVHLALGPKDLPAGPAERFQQFVGKPAQYSFDHNECHFVVAGHFAPEQLKDFVDWLEADLDQARDSVQTVIFAFPFPLPSKEAKSQPEATRLAGILKQHKVTAWFGGPEPWGPALNQPDDVPLVTTPSVSLPAGFSRWSTVQFTHAVVRVYSDRLEIALQPRTHDLRQELTILNPKRSALPAATDPPFLADYRADTAQKPLLTFVQLSDTQLDDFSTGPRERHGHRSAPQINEQAFKEINALDPPPAFVTVTGDLTNKSTDAEWQQYMGFIQTLKVPVYHIPGNHDIDPPTAENPKEPTLHKFSKYTGGKPYYSWEAKDAYFIALDSSTGNIGPAQLAWLKTELEKSRKHRYLFVLAHHTIASVGAIQQGRSEVAQWLREYHASGYLCGHLHVYEYVPVDGMLHIVCNDLCWEDGNGYLIYHLFPDHLVACYKPVGQPRYWRISFPNRRAVSAGSGSAK